MLDYITIDGDMLVFDGIACDELAREYGTPLYVLSLTAIRERIAELRADFTDRYPGTRAAYASKAFLSLAMCRIIEEEGLALDVVSGGELYTAMKAGFPADRIEMHGNNKLPEEIDKAMAYGVGRIIVDAPDEFDLIEASAQRHGVSPGILLRINPGVETDTHDFISTANHSSKFGFSPDNMKTFDLISRISSSAHADFLGIHFHIGSQLFDNTSHLAALERSLALCLEIKEKAGIEVRELNIGGGFGIRYTDEERRPYSYFFEPVMKRLSSFCAETGMRLPTLVTEPGRSIVGDAGMTLYTVGAVRKSPGGITYVAIDGGMPDNIRPALYGAKYDALIANKASLSRDEMYTIAGKCCESGDRIIDDIMLPRAKRGDLLAVFSTGAYGYSMASNYNKLPIPAVVLTDAGSSRLMVRRQTDDDIIARDILLPRLSPTLS